MNTEECFSTFFRSCSDTAIRWTHVGLESCSVQSCTVLTQFSKLSASPPLPALRLDVLWVAIEDRCVAFFDGCDIEATGKLAAAACFTGKRGIVVE